ncbi:TIGR01440 family protein [Barrientosiimonas marina]|uniref:UPF0340 protein ACFQU8_11610 n=1 Tax=Lentibacillus kimchii TaxID=1542911 RepID=A0ABW2UX38_9BACI
MALQQQVRQDMDALAREWLESGYLQAGDVFVVGCSTSEVAGERIGTSGSEDIAAALFASLENLKADTGITVAFQCCEHLNRALVVDKSARNRLNLEEVSAVPVPDAGGSMAAYAYKQMNEPAVVETIRADSGIDIGDTMIGMHLKPVAVPLRFNQRLIGEARVTAARTRPKLIGGERAVYRV